MDEEFHLPIRDGVNGVCENLLSPISTSLTQVTLHFTKMTRLDVLLQILYKLDR